MRSLNPSSLFTNDCGTNSSSDSESCKIANKLLQITEDILMFRLYTDLAQSIICVWVLNINTTVY